MSQTETEQYENLYGYYRLAMTTDQNDPKYETYRNLYLEMWRRAFGVDGLELDQDDFFEYCEEREEAERETEPEYSDSEDESDDELWESEDEEDELPPPLYEEVSTPPPYDFLPPPPYR